MPQAQAEYAVPAAIGDYTDFYTSIHHATNVGKLFRPDNPLLPNYKWVPIGYHGRGSSIGVSGQAFPRPRGPDDAARRAARRCSARAGASTTSSSSGSSSASAMRSARPIPIADAERTSSASCLLNDWSARDIQAWEYQPLGPFLAKSFATTVSPWVVTLEALAPFRVEWTRPAGDPQPLPYLDSPETRARGALDVQLEAWLETRAMRDAGSGAARLSHSSMRHAYWTIGQMVAHHTVNGCNLQPGDLLRQRHAVGADAPARTARSSSSPVGGKQPVKLPNGETRTLPRGRRLRHPARPGASATGMPGSASANAGERSLRPRGAAA